MRDRLETVLQVLRSERGASDDSPETMRHARRQVIADLGATAEALRRQGEADLAEARVLHALAAGVSLNDFERRRGVSIHTVRKQVATMMVKMDCTRQVDLVRVALRVG